jgi:hypothetical protein
MGSEGSLLDFRVAIRHKVCASKAHLLPKLTTPATCEVVGVSIFAARYALLGRHSWPSFERRFVCNPVMVWNRHRVVIGEIDSRGCAAVSERMLGELDAIISRLRARPMPACRSTAGTPVTLQSGTLSCIPTKSVFPFGSMAERKGVMSE